MDWFRKSLDGQSDAQPLKPSFFEARFGTAEQAAEKVWQSGGVASNVSTAILCRNIACYVSGSDKKSKIRLAAAS